jgi:hypothetical protein
MEMEETEEAQPHSMERKLNSISHGLPVGYNKCGPFNIVGGNRIKNGTETDGNKLYRFRFRMS